MCPGGTVSVFGESFRLKSPTCRPAVAVLPVPPLVELTLPVTLVNIPGCVPVTLTLGVHWPPAAMVAPESEIVLPPVVAKVPPHAIPVPLATVKPAGSTSVKATPASGTVLAVGLVIVNPRDVVPLMLMSEGVNALAIDGAASTNKLALAVLPVPPSFEVTADVVLLTVPADTPFTLMEKLHVPPAASEPPERLIEFDVALIVPLPQLPLTLVGWKVTSLCTRSLRLIPVSAKVGLGFVIWKPRLVEPPSGMLLAPKLLLATGGATTVMLAVGVLPVPALLELTVVLLFFTPAVVPCTVVETEQLLLAAILPPVRLSVKPPLPTVAVPPQVLVAVGPETIKPEGNESVN